MSFDLSDRLKRPLFDVNQLRKQSNVAEGAVSKTCLAWGDLTGKKWSKVIIIKNIDRIQTDLVHFQSTESKVFVEHLRFIGEMNDVLLPGLLAVKHVKVDLFPRKS